MTTQITWSGVKFPPLHGLVITWKHSNSGLEFSGIIREIRKVDNQIKVAVREIFIRNSSDETWREDYSGVQDVYFNGSQNPILSPGVMEFGHNGINIATIHLKNLKDSPHNKSLAL